MGLLTIGDVTFNVVVEGADDAPTLMLSNSLGTNLHMWDAQMPALRNHFRVIRYDARGHGESDVPAGPYSIDQLGRDALAIMDALDVRKVFWMGLSMGGMVGQWLLAHAPERIERAVLANTAARMSGTDGWNSRIATVLADGMVAVTDAVIERWFTPAFMKSDAELVQPLVGMLHATKPAGYAGCCAAIRDMDLREGIRGADIPVLVVVGRHDPSTPPAEGEAIAAVIPGAELVALEAAHLSNIEDEAAFTAAVVGFLTAPPRRARLLHKAATARRKKATPAARPTKITRTTPTRTVAAKPKAKTKAKAEPKPKPKAAKATKAKTVKAKTARATPKAASPKVKAASKTKIKTVAKVAPKKATKAKATKPKTTAKTKPKATKTTRQIAKPAKPAAKKTPARGKATKAASKAPATARRKTPAAKAAPRIKKAAAPAKRGAGKRKPGRPPARRTRG
jgi:3-oxoadipate enol-lactonase